MAKVTRLKVVRVDSRSVAELSGVQVGDVLEAYGGITLTSNEALMKGIENNKGNEQLVLFRNRERLTLDVVSGRLGLMINEIEIETDTYYSDAELLRRVNSMVVTTTPSVDGFKTSKILDIVSSECVFGLSVFKDFFTLTTDFFGGRSNTAQNALRDARKKCIDELKSEAAALGANAVVGVSLDYSEFSGQGKSMLFLVASGTAVIVEPLAAV